jgi:hypothetical protein
MIPLPPADANSLDDAVVMTPMLDQHHAAMVSIMPMVITALPPRLPDSFKCAPDYQVATRNYGLSFAVTGDALGS